MATVLFSFECDCFIVKKKKKKLAQTTKSSPRPKVHKMMWRERDVHIRQVVSLALTLMWHIYAGARIHVLCIVCFFLKNTSDKNRYNNNKWLLFLLQNVWNDLYNMFPQKVEIQSNIYNIKYM